MKKHLLLTGFSCTGKTHFAKKAFGEAGIIDSDDEILEYIIKARGHGHYDHIYEIFMGYGRKTALELIKEAEESLCAKWTKWASDADFRIISVGPSFPSRENWKDLQKVSHVVLLEKSPELIYDRFLKRRGELFEKCPKAEDDDSWDIDVMVKGPRQVCTRDEAIKNIKDRLQEREGDYRKCDDTLCTDDADAKEQEAKKLIKRLQEIKAKLDGDVAKGA